MYDWRRMTRVLQILALALAVLGGRVAHAGKPNVVILGLEVVDKGGGIDANTAQLAKDFTSQLRARASAAGQLVAHSDKELVDEKLLRNCNSADPSCIAPIGSELGAAYLIYGSLEKTTTGAKVSLHLLNVATKQATKHFPTDMRDTSPGGLSDAAAKAYAALMGGDAGSININVNNDGVDVGTVTVGKDKRDLKGGHVMVKDLGPDRYTVQIDVTGFQRFEQTVSLGQGEKKDMSVTLVPLAVTGPARCGAGSVDCGNTVSASGGHSGLKIVGWSAIAVAVVAGGVTLYEWKNKHDYETGPAPTVPMGGEPAKNITHYDDVDCDSAPTVRNYRGQNSDGNKNFDGACTAHKIIPITGTVAGVAAAVGIVGLILAYRGGDETEHHAQTSARKQKKPLIAVTPIVSPDGAGASVRIDF